MRVILHFTAYTSHRVKHATCPFLDALTCKRPIYFEQDMSPAVNTSQKAFLKKIVLQQNRTHAVDACFIRIVSKSITLDVISGAVCAWNEMP